MARKALLIGAQINGLRGVDHDVAAMSQALTARGFQPTIRLAGDATRDGILDGYERLITDARPDDVVVIYYSGHGGFVRPTGYERRPPVALQFIVPTDYRASTDDDFRAVTSIELSLLLGRLTAKTRNVTVVLDCCHSAQMSRDGELSPDCDPQPKAIADGMAYEVLEQHLRRTGLAIDKWNPLGNRDAVRIVACAADQVAYEVTMRDGQRVGLLTHALTGALAEAGDLPVTWSNVIDRVRRRVLDLIPTQLPALEGPARRRLFEVVEVDALGTLRAIAQDDRVRLDGGPLLGVERGDEFAIMPAGAAQPDTTHRLADVRIDALDATAAYGQLRYADGVTSLPLGATAHRTRSSVPPFVVRLPAAGPAELAREVGESTRLRAARPDEQCAVEVRFDGHELTVADQIGPLHEPVPADARGVHDVLRALTRLSHVDILRRLTESATYALPPDFTIDFGDVTPQGERIRPSVGEVLHVGQRIFVRFHNTGRDPVYLTLFDIGVLATITRLTGFAPNGVKVEPGQEYAFGWNDLTRRMAGAALSWPAGAAVREPRPESILAVVTSAPQDLGVFEQDGVRGQTRGYPDSPLEQAFALLKDRATRDLPADLGPGLRYAVRRIDFTLLPAPTEDDLLFAVDERPAPSMLLATPRSASPMKVALRVNDVVIHRNRALGAADIRLDTLVVTRADGGQLACAAHTERINNIRDNQPLPLDQLQLFNGPVVDYLDVAIWASRDSRNSIALSDMLRDELTAEPMQGALVTLGGLLLAAPVAATAAAAVGAGAIVIAAAYRILRRVAGDSIGLYRTTLLAQERFGLDRPWVRRQIRAQDFSFSYTVEDVRAPE